MLAALVADGRLTADEAALAARIPVAEDITAEADSADIPITGHSSHSFQCCLRCVMSCCRNLKSAWPSASALPAAWDTERDRGCLRGGRGVRSHRLGQPSCA